MENIRNFSIIAHIDHGKSTLADRFLELTGLKKPGEGELVLDNMELERERGITIKFQNARMIYKKNGKEYILNLLDTPGHMDFNYEVSRALAACEGAILLVDATQGIEAQTIVNFNLAVEENLEIIAAVNKIDLPVAMPDKVAQEIENTFLIPADEVYKISAKTGEGVKDLLDAIIEKIPPPQGDPAAPLKALIVDSYYDPFRGVILKVRIFDGEIKKGDKILLMSSGHSYEVDEVGVYEIHHKPVEKLTAGEVGYIIAGIKNIEDVDIGDTITLKDRPTLERLPGFKKIKSMVYATIFPVYGDQYEDLKKALQKLKLNDASLTFTSYNSPALGMGFRCGFLGMLHMEIVQERLEREYNLDIVITAPNVPYKVYLQNGEVLDINNPADFPENIKILKVEEPVVKGIIISPVEYVGNVMKIAREYRGEFLSTENISQTRIEMLFEFPLSEIIFDFLDKLKSVTRGYASFDYEVTGFKEADLVKVNVLIHRKKVDALSFIVHRDKAYYQARNIVKRLKEVIPKQLFEVDIQAAIGSKVIATEKIKPLRKDVTAKCYGGDVTRKRKLLEKQKEGKKRMKKIGKVDVPQEAFLSVLKIK